MRTSLQKINPVSKKWHWNEKMLGYLRKKRM